MRAPIRYANPILMAMLGLVACVLLLVPWVARAGGPLIVGGPSYGVDGQPFLWDLSAMPIPYRVDGGPLSRKPDGTIVVDNASGLSRIQAMFQVWQDVPTSAISFSNAGPLLSTGAFTDGDVDTAEEFNAVYASCGDGTQSPVVFDADGGIFYALMGDPSVIGLAGPCDLDSTTGRITSGLAAFSGRFQDGIDDPASYPANYEMTSAEFNETIAHEFGHFAGLDHSQINVQVLLQPYGHCASTDLAGLPVMFPFAHCQARTSAGLPMLAPDDLAWISYMYQETVNAPPTRIPFNTKYGTISGTILFSDGESPAQDVNVIARDSVNPRKVAVSVVSGYRVTWSPGQTVSGDNDPGALFGSRNPLLAGAYDIPVPAGTYTVEVESISSEFTMGSTVGPFDPPLPSPGPNEFWNTNESATDSVTDKSNITVSAGAALSDINIILNGTAPRFDSFESAGLWPREPMPAWIREEDLSLDRVRG
jgi:hypothetical protein